MIIKCDVDNVLRDIITPSIRIYKEFYNPMDNTKYEDIKVYDLRVALPLMKNPHEFFTRSAQYIFGEAKPFLGAVSFMKKLSEQGHYIAIVSNQIRGVEKYTLQWLQEYNIPYDSVHFVKDKSVVKGDLLIDDCIDNLVACEKHHVVACYDQPWNQKWEGLRFSSYSEILDWVNNTHDETYHNT